MKHIFYGRNEITDYNPCILNMYGAKVPSLGKYNHLVNFEEFFRKDNVNVEIKENTYIEIDGESVYIDSIKYDITNDSFKCYTNKILSRKDGNMTKLEALRKLDELENKGFFRRLFR